MVASLKKQLDEAYLKYAQESFIGNDPIQIPYQFSSKQDIEISGFFAAIFAWGQRVTIINKTKDLMERMNWEPYKFLMTGSESDWFRLEGFKHRTFNDDDLYSILKFLKTIYSDNDSLEDFLFTQSLPNVYDALVKLKTGYQKHPDYLKRTDKHIPSPLQNSACKRLNMYFRWMVRKDDVDFGLWTKLKPSQLICPLDVHVINVSLKLGLLDTDKGDWKSAVKLTDALKKLDSRDPVKYDLALFSMGVSDGE